MNLSSAIESLLFISAKPMSAKQLSEITKEKEEEVEKIGNELVEYYKTCDRGMQIIKNGHKFQMVSAPENANVIQEFIKDETTGDLSRPSLETLTIVAYLGPIKKSDLDRIRGVNCSLILRNLLLRGLVEVKTDKKNEENIYSVSFDFIRFLGVNNLEELPDYERLRNDEILQEFLTGKKEVKEEDDSSADSTGSRQAGSGQDEENK